MEAERTRTRWTYAEFARLPSEGSTRHEIIDDELYVTPSPSLRHQRVVTDLVSLLNEFVRSHDLGHLFVSPLDVLLAEGDHVEPDLLFVRRDRAGILTDRGVEGAPDLVVEVLSPSTAGRDRGIKLERYRLFGVAEYWIVDPESRTVELWRLSEGAEEAVVLKAPEHFRWEPAPGGPALEIRLEELFPAA
ncbi:MAG TPA: Uma2 family endonuclease [Longimicrobiales bacterium]|nr:Uma2 family endonuclease [Longimicrobiales bacterium]